MSVADEQVGVKHDGGKPPMHLIAWDAVKTAAVHHDGMIVSMSSFDIAVVVQDRLSDWWHGAHMHELAAAFWGSLAAAGTGSPWRGLVEVARVLDFGAKKYAPRNWEKGLPHSRTFAAAQRHACARLAGEVADIETGLDHWAHFACELMFSLAFEVRGRTDLDDRPKAAHVVA